MTERPATEFLFENKIRPMNEENFADIELAIRSLRDMTPINEYEYIVVSFKNRIKKLDFIQAYSSESYKVCYIEMGFKRTGKEFAQIFAIENVPIEKTVEIFKSVCCSKENPDLKDWEDVTEKILNQQGKEDK